MLMHFCDKRPVNTGVFHDEAPTAQESASVKACQVPSVPPPQLTSTFPSPVLFMVRSAICSPLWHVPQFGPCCVTQSVLLYQQGLRLTRFFKDTHAAENCCLLRTHWHQVKSGQAETRASSPSGIEGVVKNSPNTVRRKQEQLGIAVLEQSSNNHHNVGCDEDQQWLNQLLLFI